MIDMSPRVPRSPTAPLLEAIEGVRALSEGVWTSLAGLKGERGNGRFLFTATEESAGTTLIAASCAIGLARSTRSPVLLVEANLRRPALASYLGVAAEPGLSELLAGHAGSEEVRRIVPGCPGLVVIPAGTPRHLLAGELSSDAPRELLAGLAGSARYVLFDAPPLLGYPESRALLQHVDGAVLVLRARASRKADARHAVEMIEGARVEVLGSVLNRFKSELPFDERG